MKHSMRIKLAVTYAGIALLTLAVVGLVLVGVLDRYFARTEQAYLNAVAERAQAELLRRSNSTADLVIGTQILALTSGTRVEVYDSANNLVADSGSPQDIDPESLLPPDGRSERDGDRRQLPSPVGSGVFGTSGGEDAPRSSRELRAALVDRAGQPAGTLVLSEGPAYGTDVLASVIEVLAVAALIAMSLAAAAGYYLSQRITRPIEALTGASDRMADGDLGARAPVASEDEVGRLAASFNAMADRIELTVVTLRRFVADAAHEIGTPLTALQADLELADAARTEGEEREFVSRALGQARRIESLSGNLLRLSRLEAGELPDAEERVDLTRLVRETADAAASRAEQAGIELEVTAPDEALPVVGDRAKLQVVLDNLIDNAFKFTPAHGSVALGVRADKGHAVVWVADTGIGIPDAEQPEIFSRFYRARNVASYPGSGLGLAIVLATVEGYHGTVQFQSTEQGTRFEVRLPLA